MTRTYILATDGNSITCTNCGTTSYNKNDVLYRFCSKCHQYHEGSRCDFCCAPEVEFAAEYIPKGQMIGTVKYPHEMTVVDTAPWGACEGCKLLIESKQWPELMARCLSGAIDMDSREVSKDPKKLAEQFNEILTTVFGDLE